LTGTHRQPEGARRAGLVGIVAVSCGAIAALTAVLASSELAIREARAVFDESDVLLGIHLGGRLPLEESVRALRALPRRTHPLPAPLDLRGVHLAYPEPLLEGLEPATVRWYRNFPIKQPERFLLLGASNDFLPSHHRSSWITVEPEVIRRWLETKDGALLRQDTLARLGLQVGDALSLPSTPLGPIELRIVGTYTGQMPAHFIVLHYGYLDERAKPDARGTVNSIGFNCDNEDHCEGFVQAAYRALRPPVVIETTRDRQGANIELRRAHTRVLRLLAPFAIGLFAIAYLAALSRLRERGRPSWAAIVVGAVLGGIAAWLGGRSGLALGSWAFERVPITATALAIGSGAALSIGALGALLPRGLGRRSALLVAASLSAAAIDASLSIRAELLAMSTSDLPAERHFVTTPPRLSSLEIERLAEEVSAFASTAPPATGPPVSIELKTEAKHTRGGVIESYTVRGVSAGTLAHLPTVTLTGPRLPTQAASLAASPAAPAPPLSLWASPQLLDRLGLRIGDPLALLGLSFHIAGSLQAGGTGIESELWCDWHDLAPSLAGLPAELVLDVSPTRASSFAAELRQRFPDTEVATAAEIRKGIEDALELSVLARSAILLYAVLFFALLLVSLAVRVTVRDLLPTLLAATAGVLLTTIVLGSGAWYYMGLLYRPHVRLLPVALALGYTLVAVGVGVVLRYPRFSPSPGPEEVR